MRRSAHRPRVRQRCPLATDAQAVAGRRPGLRRRGSAPGDIRARDLRRRRRDRAVRPRPRRLRDGPHRHRIHPAPLAAFFTDPVMSWCYPDTDRRATILSPSFRILVEAKLPHGGVDTVADGTRARSGSARTRSWTRNGLSPTSAKRPRSTPCASSPCSAARRAPPAARATSVLVLARHKAGVTIGAHRLRPHRHARLPGGDERTQPRPLPAPWVRGVGSRDPAGRPPLWCMWRTPKTTS